MNQLELNWYTGYIEGQYYELMNLDLKVIILNKTYRDLLEGNNNLEGVYVIWYMNQNGTPQAVYTGQGQIRDRIKFHRTNPNIEPYKSETLYVMWAGVNTPMFRNRVEKYLFNTLNPLVFGEEPPRNVEPLFVNLPPPWPQLDPPSWLV